MRNHLDKHNHLKVFHQPIEKIGPTPAFWN